MSTFGVGRFGTATFGSGPVTPPPEGDMSIPAEQPYLDIELDLIDNEPPGLFPEGQDSYWGQMRRLFAEYLQTQISDMLTSWYNNIDPRTVDGNDIKNWENMLGIPPDPTRSLEQRRATVISRMSYGPFTRAARADIVEAFLVPTFGAAITFSPSGVPLSAGGVQIFSGVTSLTGTYSIAEDISNFAYQVNLTIPVDTTALARELARRTPAGINFTISTNGAIVHQKTGGARAAGIGGNILTGLRRARAYWAEVQINALRSALVTFAEMQTGVGVSLGSSLPARLIESPGAIRYVSATDGSDTYDGTASTFQGGTVGPWATIAKGVATITAGQTLRIRSGTYTAAQVDILNNSGTAINPKTIEAFPNETVTLVGVKFRGTSSYWRLRNVICDGSLTDVSSGTKRSWGVKVDDNTNHIELYNVECKNYSSTSEGNPQGILCAGIAPDTIHIYNCNCHNNGRVPDNSLDHGIYIAYGTNYVIANTISVDNSAYGIQVYPTARNVIITNCVLDGSHVRSGMVEGNDDGTANGAANITVRNTLFTNNSQYGLDVYYPTGNAPNIAVGTVTNSDFYNNPSGDHSTGVSANPTYAANLAVDPQYVNRALKNFRPQNLALKGAGDPAYTPSFDFTGAARSSADLGAYVI